MLILLMALIGLLSVAILAAGFLALLRNPKKPQNRWFFIFACALSLWIPFNFYDSTFISLFWTSFILKLDFASALFVGWSFVEFVESFELIEARQVLNLRARISRALSLGLNLLFVAASFSGLLITASFAHYALKVRYGPVYPAYTLLLLAYFIYGLSRLLYKRLRAASLQQRKALQLIFNGLLIATIANLLTNLVFPALINTRATVKALNVLGYAGITALVLLIYLAITTQKLFDIRLIVARSLAYILSLGAIAGIFFLAALGALDVVFHNNLSPGDARLIYAILTVALALAFPPLKHFFDVATRKFFFRDAYDTQSFLDEFNKVLVATYELTPLLKKSAQLIEKTLKPSYCTFIVHQPFNTKGRTLHIGTHMVFDKEEMQAFTEKVTKLRKKIIVADDLTDKYLDFKYVLDKKGASIIVRLAISSSGARPDIGYLVLGLKKSGNLYSAQDLKVIEIVANELVIAIQNALRFEEIENFNLTLQAKVDEATRKLRKANERLRTMDETKDDFISMASHQLRTPLTSIKGYLSMVLEGDAGKVTGTQREMLGQAFSSSQRMVYLIADLLNISRLKTGKFIIEPTQVDLAEVVEQELEQLKETAAARSLTLQYEKPKAFSSLMLDETKTRQVIMNFVDNAIYYTPSGGHITVRLLDNASTVELRVEDDGIGVPKSEQPHLFTKFYRAGNARKARPDGTGLGLFMAKKVIVAQGGSLIFESQEGKGSTFGFVFSKSKLAAAAHQAQPSTPVAVHL